MWVVPQVIFIKKRKKGENASAVPTADPATAIVPDAAAAGRNWANQRGRFYGYGNFVDPGSSGDSIGHEIPVSSAATGKKVPKLSSFQTMWR